MLLGLSLLVSAALIGWGLYGIRPIEYKDNPMLPVPTDTAKTKSNDSVPKLASTTVASGLSIPWDLDFIDEQTLLITERGGDVSIVRDGKLKKIYTPADVAPRGEGGLMSITLDPDFANNSYVYLCMNAQGVSYRDVRVLRMRLLDDTLVDRVDIITGMPDNDSGRHSGCRLRFGNDGFLWVATGDAAIGTTPQDPKSLGGKILRVTRDGTPASGNLAQNFDPRVFSYGHRNSQGLAMLPAEHPSGIAGYSVEHGPDVDDEINTLIPGNFGWNPVPRYNESVKMTDTTRYPNAIEAVWSSGLSTLAPSGATIIAGEQWGAWEGRLAVAFLKDKQVSIFPVNDDASLGDPLQIATEFGRIRSVRMSPNGDMYLCTSNGAGNDAIIKISASQG